MRLINFSGDRILRTICIVLIFTGVIFFLLNWIGAKEFNIFDYYTSDYVHSKFGLLSTLGFILIGLGIFISSNIFSGKLSGFEKMLLIYSVLFISLAVFPTDRIGESSLIGLIHKIIATICFLFFLIFTSFYIFKNHSDLTLIIIILNLISFIGLIMMGLNFLNYKGLFQRIYIFSQILLIIIFLINNRLLGNDV